MSSATRLSTKLDMAGTLYLVALTNGEIGRRVRVARTAAGLSQQELAEKIGLRHAQDVSRYERGKQEVPAFRIDLIAEATGRPRSYFVRDSDEPEPLDQSRLDRLEAAVAETNDLVRALIERIEAA